MPHASGGVRHVRVKVFAGAKREAVNKTGENSFEIFVREPAERNLANRRVLEIISTHYGKPARIISGHRGPNKTLAIRQA